MSDALLQIKNVCAGYGNIKVLHDVSLEIKQGEIVTLIGANGAGKSTLLMSIFANPKISSGQILLAGKSLHDQDTHEIASQGIALVPEGRRLFPQMSVLENLLLGELQTDEAKRNSMLAKIYDWFPILKERATQSAGTLSGGEQQMVAIGRALMSYPKVLLLDEPSLGLAPIMVQKIFRILKEIAASGTTLFLVEQNAHKALQMADRGYVLVNGTIQLTGSGQELLENDAVKAAYLGELV